MATMYEKMMERLVDRVADQAVELAKLKEQNALNAKNAAHWQQRAIDLGFQVEEAERANVRLHEAEHLLRAVEKYHDRLFAHGPETFELIMNISEHLRPDSMPVEPAAKAS